MGIPDGVELSQWFALGEVQERRVATTPAMGAILDGKNIHPVVGTAALVTEMEAVSRLHLARYLAESGMEGCGMSVQLKHRAPAPLGAILCFRSTLVGVTPKRVTSRVEACWQKSDGSSTVVGVGTVVQGLIPLQYFEGV